MAKQFNITPSFRNVYVKGEVSNTYISQYKHIYFDLKDKSSKVPCMIHKDERKRIDFAIKNGMKLLVIADVGVYWKHGKYQLNIKEVAEDGLGKLFVRYQQLKEKLDKEGLFNPEFKKPLPKFAKRIGVVTSKGGAVIHDIVKTVTQNWPYCEVLLFPSAVQGPTAARELVMQIKRADSFGLDVLIVGRGGGSLEDLWCFNEEVVARAIFGCKTPVISAVGHESDVTLTDLVADVRASTPTMAASLAIEDRENISNQVNQYNLRLLTFIDSKLEDYKKQLSFMISKPIFTDPDYVCGSKRADFDDLCKRFGSCSSELVNSRRHVLEKITTEYVVRHPCKMQLDSSSHDLNELQSRLIDSMNSIINEYKVNLDKVANNFDFLSDKLVTSRRHDLEMMESFFISNPCQNSIELSRNELNVARDKAIGSVNLKLDSDRKNLELLSNNFRNASQGLILRNSYGLDTIRKSSIIKNPQRLYESKRDELEGFKSYFKSNPYQDSIDIARNELKIAQDKMIANVNVKVDNNRKDFELMLNKFANASNGIVLANAHELDSIMNMSVIRNPQKMYEVKKDELERVKNKKNIKNPYLILDQHKRELDVYKEKMDKISQVIELKREQQKQKSLYVKIIVAIVIVMIIILLLIFGGI